MSADSRRRLKDMNLVLFVQVMSAGEPGNTGPYDRNFQELYLSIYRLVSAVFTPGYLKWISTTPIPHQGDPHLS